MRGLWRLLLPGLAMMGLLRGAPAQPLFRQTWPPGLRERLATVQSMELYSLEPTRPEHETGFHGWRVLGQARLDARAAHALGAALLEGVERRTEPKSSDCFAPRHGLRLGDIDLVICFECHRLQAYREGRSEGELLMTDLAASVFQDAVRQRHLAWDGWVKDPDGRWRTPFLSIAVPSGFSESYFGATLRLRRPAPRIEPLPVRPLGTAVLVDENGAVEELEVGNQELKGWSELANPLGTYFPGLEVDLDEAANRLTLSGPGDVLEKARSFLLAASRPVSPETSLSVTCLQKSPEQSAARYRRSWEMDYALTLTATPSPPASCPVREFHTGTAVVHGVPTRFSVALIGDSSHPVLLQTEQPETDRDGDAMAALLATLRWGPE